MPSRPGREPGDGTAARQKRAAAELSDHAAESVGRRYDATKETHHDERARAGTGEEPPEEERDGDDDEGAA